METKEKLYWDLKKVIRNSKVSWLEIQQVLKDLSKQSVKEMASFE